MIGSRELAEAVYDAKIDTHISFVGSHISALPKEVLELECVDSVLLNEGVYALWNLLRSNLSDEELKKVKGIGWKDNSKSLIGNSPEKIVPQERMDIDLLMWDLLPKIEKP